jgi:hypothetical protein
MLITLSSNDPFLINIIEKLAEINHLSTSEIAIVYDRVTTHVQEPSVSQNVRDEVTQLAKTLADIENDFSTVERHLLRIDNKKEVVVDGRPRVYAPEWRKIHDVFLPSVSHSKGIVPDPFFKGIHPTHSAFSNNSE